MQRRSNVTPADTIHASFKASLAEIVTQEIFIFHLQTKLNLNSKFNSRLITKNSKFRNANSFHNNKSQHLANILKQTKQWGPRPMHPLTPSKIPHNNVSSTPQKLRDH